MYATDPKATPRSGMFDLPPLPYAYDALEPVISRQTLQLHYDKHHRAYVEKLNELVEGTELENAPLDEVVRRSVRMPAQQQIFNNAGQAWNHHFYWRSLTPHQSKRPTGELRARIDRDFGNFESFAERFIEACVNQFGSGWAWLVREGDALKIVTTANADTPLAHGNTPLLTVDVWEHAYYVDYQNRRQDYAKEVVRRLLNWDFAAQNFAA